MAVDEPWDNLWTEAASVCATVCTACGQRWG